MRPAQDGVDARESFQQRANVREAALVVHVDVGDLMVGDGKGRACAGIQNLPSELIANRDQAVLAEHPIGMHGRGHVREPYSDTGSPRSAGLVELHRIHGDPLDLREVRLDAL